MNVERSWMDMLINILKSNAASKQIGTFALARTLLIQNNIMKYLYVRHLYSIIRILFGINN